MDKTKLNDAEIFGDISPEINERSITIGLGSCAAHPVDKWKNHTMTGEQLISMLSAHKEGTKDGPCMLQGAVIGGKRRAGTIRSLDLLSIDLDTGESVDAVCDKITELGLFAILYSTHSHLKSVTEIKKTELIKFIQENREPDLDDAVNYLLQKKHYQPEVLEGASLLKTEHTVDGVMVRVKHQAMPKFRIVFILDEPYVMADRHPDPNDSLTEWHERYAGVSKLIGAHFDRSCIDPSRLFFLPRRPKGEKKFFVGVLAGKLLNINEVPRVTAEELRNEDKNPFLQEEKAVGKDYETKNLLKFVAKYGNKFEIEDFLEERGLDNRGHGSQGGTIFECPNDGAHSNAGDSKDMGFWCRNADGESQFVVKCHHTGCLDISLS